MKLYRYETIESLNENLAKFDEAGIKVAKVKLLTESESYLATTVDEYVYKLKTVYFVLTDESNNYQQKEN